MGPELDVRYIIGQGSNLIQIEKDQCSLPMEQNSSSTSYACNLLLKLQRESNVHV